MRKPPNHTIEDVDEDMMQAVEAAVEVYLAVLQKQAPKVKMAEYNIGQLRAFKTRLRAARESVWVQTLARVREKNEHSLGTSTG